MLLPRELIYIEKNNFDLLVKDPFVGHVFNILIDMEDREGMQLLESNENIESIYVAFFNMVFYLASEARMKSNPFLRIKEYVSYIEVTSIQQGLNEKLCREIALSLLYYLHEDLPMHDTIFLERLKIYIKSEYLFNKIGECKTELQSKDFYFAWYGAIPRYTLEYLKKCAWKKITHNYDMNSIRYILEHTTSYKCERKNIADSIMYAIEEDTIEHINGPEIVSCCRNCITEFLEEIGGWPGELDYKGIVRSSISSTEDCFHNIRPDNRNLSVKTSPNNSDMDSSENSTRNFTGENDIESTGLDATQLILLFEALLNVPLDSTYTNISALSRFIAKISGRKHEPILSKINEIKGGKIGYDSAKVKKDAEMLIELLKPIDREKELLVVSRLKENFGM